MLPKAAVVVGFMDVGMDGMAFTVIVVVALVAGDPVAQVALEVSTQVTASLLLKLDEL